jgi:hypothetical protein
MNKLDFFVSYNGHDKAWAEWIAWTLEEAGYSVVIQAWDFRPGENFVLKMHEAAVQCDKTIAVLSENYLSALFTKPEWAAAFVDDPTGGQPKLVPVRVGKCQVKGLLKAIVYVDLVGLSEEQAKLALLGAFSRRAKPRSSPAFPPMIPRVTPTAPSFPAESKEQGQRTAGRILAVPATADAGKPLSSQQRLALMQELNGMIAQQFNMLVYAVNPPAGMIPGMPAPQADRVHALLNWAESPTGCGIDTVNETLQAIIQP